MENDFNHRTTEPYLYSCNGMVTDVNKEFIDFTGYKLDEVLGKSLLELGNMIKINSQIYIDNIRCNYIGHIFTKLQSVREVNISLLKSNEINEKLYSFVEKPNSRLEDKLMFEEEIFKDDKSGVAVYSVPDLILLKANQKYLNLVDLAFNKKTNSIGSPISEIVKAFGIEAEVIWNSIIKTQKRTSYIKEFVTGNLNSNITYWRFVQTAIFERKKIKYIFETVSKVNEKVFENQYLGQLNNITERTNANSIDIIEQSKKIEKYKKELENTKCKYEFFHRMIDTLELPVIRISCPDLKIVDINKKAFGIFNLTKFNVKSIKNIENIEIEDLFNKIDMNEYYNCISEVIKERKTRYFNKKNYLINKNSMYWNVIFEPMLDLNGKIQEILILIIDVTTEMKANIDMGKELKLQGEFFVNISHDLKTPLNVISATAQLFDMYCKSGLLDDKRNSIIKYIESIKQNSYRLSKLINNIADLSKIQSGFFKLKLSNNNIVETVEQIVMSVTNFTDSKGINIVFDTDTEEKNIGCDVEKIERLILNLISNAIKFTDEGGEIFVDVKDKNEFVEISVKDNGIGIEDKYLDMIFDRFKQVGKSLSRNVAGTGIGLSLVKSIVELHGGSIYVESKVGKGTKFTVMLPSKKTLNENIIYNNEVKSGDQNIKVELSNINS
ncbi:PAS domain-containing sensor histidine kinase [Clostridium psychrophilum]|uniref:PAS domain-containing sensor histidine kinase n=1 Tax=Clostridium psychrophilum TaxID=132926 RepID=UPI001C0B626A|nr:HAMP domain-containing sensor histidine kinase [Clostridium psychrophilum]MBU3181773.1 PAS domain-containing sensor histidine kinase [Clostridium psychrophilum]